MKNNVKNTEYRKKLLAHPVFLMHDAGTKVIRLQLILVSFFALIISLPEINLTGTVNFLGISISGVTEQRIFSIIFWVLLYQLSHFIWASWEAWLEWRIRQTALDTASHGSFGLKIKHDDDLLAVRNTTIYAYIIDLIGNITSETPEDLWKRLDSYFLERSNSRIELAFVRFDSLFLMFNKFQNWRWVLIEFGAPFVLSILALFYSWKIGSPFYHFLILINPLA
jgi:hypothetical protein